MKINIANINLLFHFKNYNKKLNSLFIERYSGFFSKNKKVDFYINTIFNNYCNNFSKPYVRKEKNKIFIKREDIEFRPDSKTKKYLLKIKPSIYSFDSFLRILISLILPQKNGLLIHSSSILFNNKAFLFVGKSGSGKTTISKLSRTKALIMSDELTPILSNGSIFSSPFWGEMEGKGKNIQANIEKIFIIKKSNINKIENLSLEDFLFYFMPCVMNFSKDSSTSKRIIDIATLLYKKFKISKLYFSKKDNSFLKLI